MSSALSQMYRIANELGLRTQHRDETIAVAQRASMDAGTDDSALADLTDLPFVTIDYPSSWDLDQALYIRERDHGYDVYYALADAAYFVPVGDEVFRESLQRGTSYYLPGLVLPMLPESLSEGTASLLPREERRALTFRIELDRLGMVRHTDIVRAKIRSRAKLDYRGVQYFLDARAQSPIQGHEYAESLELLAQVGTLRIQLAERRDVVRYDRIGVGLRLSDDGRQVLAGAEVRNAVQLYNEQISLLCNMEGARFLSRGEAREDGVRGIFRLHDSPTADKLDALEAFIDAAAAAHGTGIDRWQWRREGGESLADYVFRLPADPASRRLAQAIQRQAMVAARPSYYATEPGPHYGVGAQAYARFSAPMRELVGIIVHGFALARIDSKGGDTAAFDETLLTEVVNVANRAKMLQRRADKMVQSVALAQLFGPDALRALSLRSAWVGTVMGVTPTKIYIQLDSPPVDVKLYADDFGCGDFKLNHSGVSCELNGREITVGSAISLRVRERVGERWLLEPS